MASNGLHRDSRSPAEKPNVLRPTLTKLLGTDLTLTEIAADHLCVSFNTVNSRATFPAMRPRTAITGLGMLLALLSGREPHRLTLSASRFT
jgi:hypothetical protein